MFKPLARRDADQSPVFCQPCAMQKRNSSLNLNIATGVWSLIFYRVILINCYIIYMAEFELLKYEVLHYYFYHDVLRFIYESALFCVLTDQCILLLSHEPNKCIIKLKLLPCTFEAQTVESWACRRSTHVTDLTALQTLTKLIAVSHKTSLHATRKTKGNTWENMICMLSFQYSQRVFDDWPINRMFSQARENLDHHLQLGWAQKHAQGFCLLLRLRSEAACMMKDRTFLVCEAQAQFPCNKAIHRRSFLTGDASALVQIPVLRTVFGNFSTEHNLS